MTMRRRAVVPLALVAALGGAAATVAVAATPKPVTQIDPKGDVNGALDLRQVVLARGTGHARQHPIRPGTA